MKNVHINGGGLVGSLLSVFLGKRGYDVDVYERRSDMRKAGYVGGRSINLAISQRAWTAFEKAGISELIRPHVIPMTKRGIHKTDKTLHGIEYSPFGDAIYSISRAVLNEIILDYAEKECGAKFHFDLHCEDYDIEKGVLNYKNLATKEAVKVESDFIVATDGAFSNIRSSMIKQPRFDYNQTYMKVGYKELTMEAAADGSFRMDKNALHIWPHGDFMLIALPNPDGSFTCTLFLPFEGEYAFDNIQTPEKIKAFFASHFPDLSDLMPDFVEQYQQNAHSYLATFRCNPWYSGNVVLMGDAAHGVVPFYGQGVNCGFEDVRVFDELLDSFTGDKKVLFEAFNRARVDNSNALATLAVQNYDDMSNPDPIHRICKEVINDLYNKFPDRFQTSYSMVSFSNKPYSEVLKADIKQNQFVAEMSKLSAEELKKLSGSESVMKLFNAYYP